MILPKDLLIDLEKGNRIEEFLMKPDHDYYAISYQQVLDALGGLATRSTWPDYRQLSNLQSQMQQRMSNGLGGFL